MNRQDRDHLLAEQGVVANRLAQLPQSAFLTRRSLESRLRSIGESLSRLVVPEREPARVQLTFNGRPVLGSYGIFAEFGMKAVSSFNDAVATVAASLNVSLASMGPVPNKEQYQLIITGTALGSFGFDLEEYQAAQMSLEEASPVAQALDKTQDLLWGSLASDEDLADSASETDPRALEKVRAFLQVLADNEAVCAIQGHGRGVRFSDVGQIRNSLARLSRENIQEAEEILTGEFQGYLPKGRTFEFRLDDGDVLRCKAAANLGDASAINEHLYQNVSIKVVKTQIGNGRPRFVLVEMPRWE